MQCKHKQVNENKKGIEMGVPLPRPNHPENCVFFLAVMFVKIVELQHFSLSF